MTLTLPPIPNARLTHPYAQVGYDNLILATTVGSEVHGINVPGTDDHDEMGVFVEPPGIVLGLDRRVDHVIERSSGEGERSQPGDTDRTLYSLRKYMGLAIHGNPTVLLPLWAPQESVLFTNRHGHLLRTLRRQFLSQDAAHRFLGYCRSQRDRVLGYGRQSSVPNRPELIERYGWDTKYGSHALRLALQCRGIIVTGTLRLPLADDDRELVLRVKTGEFSRDGVVSWINGHIADCERILAEGRSALPEKPDRALLSTVAVQIHLAWWDEQKLRLPG